MRKNLIAVAAAVALTGATATAALAQQHPRGAAMGGRAGVSANIGGAPRGNFGNRNFARANVARPGNFARGAFVGPNRNFAARGWNPGWNRTWNPAWNRRWARGPGFWGPTIAFGGGPFLYDFAGGGCWQRRLVPTPFGLRWRLVNVCF